MFLWIFLPCLIIGGIVGMGMGRTEFTTGDFLLVLVSIAMLIFTYTQSPWNKIKNLNEGVALQLKAAGVDLSTPFALAKSVAVGGGTYAIAAIADASGFGVFMASAKVLGALGVSFTGLHLSMSALGFLLNPVVFTGISIGAGLAVLAGSIKSGDKFLSMSMSALNDNEWDRAYQCANHAFNKVILKPSRPKTMEWYNAVDWYIQSRVTEISKLEGICNRITNNPNHYLRESYLVGWAACVLIISIVILFGADWLPVTALSLSTILLVSERYQSVPMSKIVTRLPVLQVELEGLDKIRGLGFSAYNPPLIKATDYKPPLTMDQFVNYCKLVVHYGGGFILAMSFLAWLAGLARH